MTQHDSARPDSTGENTLASASTPAPVASKKRDPENPDLPTIEKLCAGAGLDALHEGSPIDEIEGCLRTLAAASCGLDPLRREALRSRVVERLRGTKVRAPARLVDAALPPSSLRVSSDPQGRSVTFESDDAWPDRVYGDEILDELRGIFERFLVLPAGAAEALALWVAHTYALDAAENSPRLAITSPAKRCGKSRMLQILQAVVARPLPVANITAASVFRAVEKFHPTLLLDETDTYLPNNEHLRGILNAGHARDGTVLRTVGDSHEPVAFSAWSPAAIAGLKRLPDTLEDRSISIAMRRRHRSEKLDRFRSALLRAKLEPLRRRIVRWIQDDFTALQAADPKLPDELDDRAADNWRPLIAIADSAWGEWPERARRIAVLLSSTRDAADESLGIMLLTDIRDIFVSTKTDRMSSENVVLELTALEHRPWAESTRGRPLTKARLAFMLKPFGVEPRTIRLQGGRTPKGYHLGDFEDCFARYLEPFPPETSAQSATPPHGNDGNGLDGVPPGVVEDATDAATTSNLTEFDACGAVAATPSTADGRNDGSRR